VMPVEGAQVSLTGTNIEAITNSEGYFRIKGLKPGKYTLVVKYGELPPLIVILEVVGGHVTHCDSRPPAEETASSISGTASPPIVATNAFRQLVLAREKEPNAGTALAELASGANLKTARTVVRLPDEAAAVAAQHQDEMRVLLEQWNRTVLAARQEVGATKHAERAVSVLRDTRGSNIISVETSARN